MPDSPLSQTERSTYCVVCRLMSQGAGVIRVVGPFATQSAAVEWAVKMRPGNRAWQFTPEVMQPPTEVVAHV